MNESNPWKIQSSKVVYKNRWIEVVEDKVITPEGTDGVYGYLKSSDSVIIVVLNDKNEVYVVKNFRYPAGEWNWELPGGGGDKQDMLNASMRELNEETGITAKHWHKLGKTWVCNGLMTETMTTYLASDLTLGNKPPEPNEPILLSKFVSLDELNVMIDEGQMNDGQSLAALYLYRRWADKDKS